VSLRGAERRSRGLLAGGEPCAPAVQLIDLDGLIEDVATSAAGFPFGAPNDLVFGPDGRLYVTGPGEEYLGIARASECRR
jgi:sugar lactone lactonase YvrE